MRWLFWNVDFEALDVDRHRDLILSRILERGRLVEVKWAMRRYGLDGIHEFFRARAHPELSPRTITFWRLVLGAKEERWPEPPDFRRNSSVPWTV